jgi:hypothetical protein
MYLLFFSIFYNINTCVNISNFRDQKHPFSYQKTPFSYKKHPFSYQNTHFPIKNTSFPIKKRSTHEQEPISPVLSEKRTDLPRVMFKNRQKGGPSTVEFEILRKKGEKTVKIGKKTVKKGEKRQKKW